MRYLQGKVSSDNKDLNNTNNPNYCFKIKLPEKLNNGISSYDFSQEKWMESLASLLLNKTTTPSLTKDSSALDIIKQIKNDLDHFKNDQQLVINEKKWEYDLKQREARMSGLSPQELEWNTESKDESDA